MPERRDFLFVEGGAGTSSKAPPKCPSKTMQLLNFLFLISNPNIAPLVANAMENAALTGHAAIVGVGANGGVGLWEGLGVSGGVSVGLAADPDGNIGLAFGGKGGGGFAPSIGYSAGGQLSLTQKPTIFSLQGNSPQLGGGGGGMGMGGSVNLSASGTVTVTGGPSSGAFTTFGGVAGRVIVPLVCVP
jgi:hypothetical protein